MFEMNEERNCLLFTLLILGIMTSTTALTFSTPVCHDTWVDILNKILILGVTKAPPKYVPKYPQKFPLRGS